LTQCLSIRSDFKLSCTAAPGRRPIMITEWPEPGPGAAEPLALADCVIPRGRPGSTRTVCSRSHGGALTVTVQPGSAAGRPRWHAGITAAQVFCILVLTRAARGYGSRYMNHNDWIFKNYIDFSSAHMLFSLIYDAVIGFCLNKRSQLYMHTG
jgi:hypothetical protein